ncbi:hypothetical protein FH972_021603 [Carpinus fangiana]|uniref:Uncharacterized protein n=1 Tax=Carpinus fangiana TaxID=176857 RepID=A0A5N6KPR7_9ROSI|nr:hypothetical protein FH972_021603 [Carpinus fangiana]
MTTIHDILKDVNPHDYPNSFTEPVDAQTGEEIRARDLDNTHERALSNIRPNIYDPSFGSMTYQDLFFRPNPWKPARAEPIIGTTTYHGLDSNLTTFKHFYGVQASRLQRHHHHDTVDVRLSWLTALQVSLQTALGPSPHPSMPSYDQLHQIWRSATFTRTVRELYGNMSVRSQAIFFSDGTDQQWPAMALRLLVLLHVTQRGMPAGYVFALGIVASWGGDQYQVTVLQPVGEDSGAARGVVWLYTNNAVQSSQWAHLGWLPRVPVHDTWTGFRRGAMAGVEEVLVESIVGMRPTAEGANKEKEKNGKGNDGAQQGAGQSERELWQASQGRSGGRLHGAGRVLASRTKNKIEPLCIPEFQECPIESGGSLNDVVIACGETVRTGGASRLALSKVPWS